MFPREEMLLKLANEREKKDYFSPMGLFQNLPKLFNLT
jgi:hypothetical protein